MKNIIKASYLAVLAIVVLAVSACGDTDYDYTGASVPANQVYFSNELPSTIEIDKNAGSFDVQLNRVSSQGSVTVPLQFTADEGNVYTVPSSVTFSDGSTTANIHITYDAATLEYGNYVGGTISVGVSEFDTTYGLSSYTFNAGATEWADIEANGSIGSYREDMVGTFFGVQNVVYNVKIQKSVVNEGMYRMVNVYSGNYPYNEAGDYDTSKEYYWVINATDPSAVYFERYDSEMNWNYGNFIFTSYVAYYMANGYSVEEVKAARPDYFGKLENGVITMPAGSMLIGMAEYNDAGLYGANKNGLFAVALPGAVIADFSVEAAYNGRFTTADDVDYAEFALAFGDDVASVRAALVPSSADIDATIAGIADGSIESVESTGGNIRLAYDGTDKYTLVVVVYNAAGEVVGSYTLEQKLQSSKDTAEQFADIALGTFTIGVQDQSAFISQSGEAWGLLFKQPFSQEAILSQSQSDPTRFKLTPFLDEAGEYPLFFTIQEDGTIVVEDVETGMNTEDGALTASDIVTVYGGPGTDNGGYLQANGYASAYDSATGLLTFNTAYMAGGYFYGFQLDTFQIEQTAGAKAFQKAVSKAKKAAKRKKEMNGKKHFVRVLKTNAKSI